MDRWLFTFFIGAILSLFLPIVPEFSQIFICLVFAFIFSFIKFLRGYSGLFFGCAWLLSFGLIYQDIWQENNLRLNDFVGKTVTITGIVANIPSKKLTVTNKRGWQSKIVKLDKIKKLKETWRFNFIVEQFNQQKLASKINIRLRWDMKENVNVQQGQQWQLKVRIKPAHGFANVGGFSYQTWLRQKKIHATGYVRHSKSNQLIQEESSYRQGLYLQLANLLDSLAIKSDVQHFIFALTFGERSEITREQWQVLQATGTQHLMAISGLHLGLIASGAFGFTLFFFRYFPLNIMASTGGTSWILQQNNRVIAFCFSSAIAFLYAYLAGFSLPTMRALIMMLLFIGAKLLAVKLSITRWLLLSITSIILLSPFSLFSVSFWLSIYAVCLILLIIWRCRQLLSVNSDNKLVRIKAWLHSLIIVQLGLSLFMLPIAALLNHQLPLSALLANIIAVPWMSFTAIPLCLLAVVTMMFSETLAIFFLELSIASLTLIWQWLNYLADQSWLFLRISHQNLLIIFVITGLLFVSYFLALSKKIVTVLLLSISTLAFTYHLYQQKNHSWQVNVLDVGQGLAVVIERNGKAILYDTGARYPSGFNLAQSAIFPYLNYQGIKVIDHLILSHADNDHAGGLAYIAEQAAENRINVVEINSNIDAVKDYSFALKKSCQQGDNFIWQGLTFSVLWPVIIQNKENDNSCVIKVSDGQFSVLLTGDISRKVEAQLVANTNTAKQLKADVVIAPHHGSKTSSSLAFIKAISPEIVIFSAGFLNRWHMPNHAVIQRYQQLNVSSYSTAKQGMIRVEINEQGLVIESYREYIKPYWFAN
jgi:competence protein ComEC